MKMFRIIAILIVVVTALGSSGTASAKAPATTAPSCAFGPVNLTVEMGKNTTFTVTKPELQASYAWVWSDGTVGNGNPASKAWNAIGDFTVYLLATSPEGFSRCHSLVHVINAATTVTTPTTTPAAPEGTPMPDLLVIKTQSDDHKYATGSITGNNNVAPVINGNNNKVVIKIEKPAAQAQATTTETPKPLSFWQKLWLGPKNFLRMVIADFNGWFDLNVP